MDVVAMDVWSSVREQCGVIKREFVDGCCRDKCTVVIQL